MLRTHLALSLSKGTALRVRPRLDRLAMRALSRIRCSRIDLLGLVPSTHRNGGGCVLQLCNGRQNSCPKAQVVLVRLSSPVKVAHR